MKEIKLTQGHYEAKAQELHGDFYYKNFEDQKVSMTAANPV